MPAVGTYDKVQAEYSGLFRIFYADFEENDVNLWNRFKHGKIS